MKFQAKLRREVLKRQAICDNLFSHMFSKNLAVNSIRVVVSGSTEDRLPHALGKIAWKPHKY